MTSGKVIFLLTFLVTSCAHSGSSISSRTEIPGSKPVKQKSPVRVTPPWQLWGKESFNESLIASAERSIEKGDYSTALISYQEYIDENSSRAEVTNQSLELRNEIALRKFGLYLRMGESKKMLFELGSYVKLARFDVKSLPAKFSLLAAYAYLHQRNYPQVLAWFRNSYLRPEADLRFRNKLDANLSEVLASINSDDLYDLLSRFTTDSVLYTKLKISLSNRQQGILEKSFDNRLFTPEFYQNEFGENNSLSSSSLSSSELGKQDPSQPLIIGTLLPLSGQYAKHGQKVKQGIELAFKDLVAQQKVKLINLDTGGNEVKAAQEYESLVGQNADFVFGPLLLRDMQAVSQKSLTLKVPFLTFVKQSGVTGANPYLLRLGTTSRDQVVTVLDYATKNFEIKNIGIVYPSNQIGKEFAYEFKENLKVLGLKPKFEASYIQESPTSIYQILDNLDKQQLDALFIPDTLDKAALILEKISQAKNTSSVEKVSNEEGKKMLLIGTALWDDSKALKTYKEHLEGAIFISPYFPKSQDAQVQAFNRDFENEFLTPAEFLAAQSYDAAKFVQNQLLYVRGASGSDSRDYVNKLLSSPDLQAVTGNLRIDPTGNISRKMKIIKVENGELTEIN